MLAVSGGKDSASIQPTLTNTELFAHSSRSNELFWASDPYIKVGTDACQF